MQNSLLSLIIFTIMIGDFLNAQSITGTYQAKAAEVNYTYVVREPDHSGDTQTDGIYGTWVVPNTSGGFVAVDANADGIPDYKRALLGGGVGSTIAQSLYKEAKDPFYLLNYLGIDLTLAFDMEQGTAIIPGIATRPAKYPTVDTENCISALTVLDITDNMDLTFRGPVVNPNGDFVWGLGIQKSNIFSWVRAIDPNVHYPKKGGYIPAPGEADSSWGMIVGRDLIEDANGARFKQVDVRWHSYAGSYASGGAQIGIDEESPETSSDYLKLDGQTGVSVTADLVTIPNFANIASSITGVSLDVGSYPMINGPGIDHDKLSFTPNQQRLTQFEVGGTWNSVGYLFDGRGSDGKIFSGDEPFAATGYYFTYNFLQAAGGFTAAFGAQIAADPADAKGAFLSGLKAGATALGIDSTVTASVADTLSSILNNQVTAVYLDLVAGGTSHAAAAGIAVNRVAPSAPSQLLGLLAMNGINVNDGDHDFDGTNGRLLFQVDAAPNGVGGICIPTQEYQEVHVAFSNIIDWIPPTGPIAPLKVNDTSVLPNEFELLDNYPNPFNPTTSISFNIPNEVYTEVAIYNMMGQKVRSLHSGNLQAGRHHIFFDGFDDNNVQLGSGVYFYRVVSGEFNATKKMMLVK